MTDFFAFPSFSEHFFQRAAERFGYNRERATKWANQVLRNGRTIEEYSGKARRYLEDIQNRRDPFHTVLLIHGNNCFVFTDTGVLKTVYSLDKAFFRLNKPKMSRFNRGDDESYSVEPAQKCGWEILMKIFIKKIFQTVFFYN